MADSHLAYTAPPSDPRLGDVLSKALVDDFHYVLGLRSGLVIRFASATLDGDWLLLRTAGTWDSNFSDVLPHQCPRGVQVRISEIAWAADAPDGS